MANTLELYKTHYEENKTWYEDEPSKYEWAATNIFNLTTYDGALDELFVKHIVEVLKVIRDRTNFEYIEDENNYVKYILVCNMLNNLHWIDWGTSIRGAWFDGYHPNCKTHYILEELEWRTFDPETREFENHKVEAVPFTKDNISALIDFLEE